MSGWALAGFGINGAMVFMAVVWLICRRINNAAFVDVAWSYAFTLVAVAYLVLGGGDPVRGGLLTAMVALWSLRLGTHLAIRVARHHPREDARYQALRAAFPQRVWLMFFGFFLLQGLLVGILSAPFAIVLSNPRPGLGPWEIAGTALWLVGFFGEVTADAQLRRFRADPANAGGVCAVGLWRFSRHPNYFFEWVIWISYFVFALGSPGGWFAVICPVIMWHFLVNVTGIPPAEEQSLKSRGDAYRAYQQTTSPFIPWFPRRQP